MHVRSVEILMRLMNEARINKLQSSAQMQIPFFLQK